MASIRRRRSNRPGKLSGTQDRKGDERLESGEIRFAHRRGNGRPFRRHEISQVT